MSSYIYEAINKLNQIGFYNDDKLTEKNEFRNISNNKLKNISDTDKNSSYRRAIVEQVFSSEFFSQILSDYPEDKNLKVPPAKEPYINHHVYNTHNISIVIPLSTQAHGRVHQVRYALLEEILMQDSQCRTLIDDYINQISNIRMMNGSTRQVDGKKIQISKFFIQELQNAGVDKDLIDQVLDKLHSSTYEQDSSKDQYSLTQRATGALVKKLQKVILSNQSMINDIISTIFQSSFEIFFNDDLWGMTEEELSQEIISKRLQYLTLSLSQTGNNDILPYIYLIYNNKYYRFDLSQGYYVYEIKGNDEPKELIGLINHYQKLSFDS